MPRTTLMTWCGSRPELIIDAGCSSYIGPLLSTMVRALALLFMRVFAIRRTTFTEGMWRSL